jgi:hypothetical protein
VTVGAVAVVVPQLADAMVRELPNEIAKNPSNFVVTVAMRFLHYSSSVDVDGSNHLSTTSPANQKLALAPGLTPDRTDRAPLAADWGLPETAADPNQWNWEVRPGGPEETPGVVRV